MVAAFGLDDLLSTREGPGGAHGHHHSLGTGVGEAHLLHRRYPIHDALGELGLRLSRRWENSPQGSLFAHRLAYGRHRMAVDRGSVVVEQINELVAVHVPDAASGAV